MVFRLVRLLGDGRRCRQGTRDLSPCLVAIKECGEQRVNVCRGTDDENDAEQEALEVKEGRLLKMTVSSSSRLRAQKRDCLRNPTHHSPASNLHLSHTIAVF